MLQSAHAVRRVDPREGEILSNRVETSDGANAKKLKICSRHMFGGKLYQNSVALASDRYANSASKRVNRGRNHLLYFEDELQ